MRRLKLTVLALAAAMVTACGQVAIGTLTEVATATSAASPPTPVPSTTPTEQAISTPAIVKLTFKAQTYRDEASGFELDYPDGWDPPQLLERQARGSIVQASLNGQVMLDIVTLQWDPANDLEAYTEVRERAFEGSGFTILGKEQVGLGEDWRGLEYRVETLNGDQAYFFFTTLGDQYLQLSGSGDLDQLAAIASTVRRTP